MSHDSREVQVVVADRLASREAEIMAMGYRQVVDTIVWETLALLGEWDLIQLDPLERKENPDG